MSSYHELGGVDRAHGERLILSSESVDQDSGPGHFTGIELAPLSQP